MSDLVDKFRNAAAGLCSEDPYKYMARDISAGDCLEIADYVEKLEAEVERYREALTEIASFTQSLNLLWWQERARQALQETDNAPHD